jgi:hypothetical protein
MSFVQTQTVGRVVQFPGGIPAQFLAPTGNRVNATAGAVVTAEAAVPSGGRVLMIRATDAVWIRFGATGMGAAAADADSILFLGGEAPYLLKTNETHFRVLRVGAADVAVQLESVETL